MKRILAGVALIGVLALTGCGMYGKPSNPTDLKSFKEFVDECKDAGGVLHEGPRDWYTCDMGGTG